MKAIAICKGCVAGLASIFVCVTVIAFAGGRPSQETAGNNLSYPVIWAEGVTKTLPGTAGMDPKRDGEWWYQWGTNGIDPNITPASCRPDPDNSDYCDDGVAGSWDSSADPLYLPAQNLLPLAKAYLQKDPGNVWQAGSADWRDSPVIVDGIDWGDNLESMDWYTKSQVRIEVVLLKDLKPEQSMCVYEMRHVSGWGIDEVHGLATSPETGQVNQEDGLSATVYSHCARLTIQKLMVKRDNEQLSALQWKPECGWYDFGDNLINAPIFNKAVYEAGDGPGYYNAEINVKGRIIYGYTWNVRLLNDGPGDYRITFSFDESCGTSSLHSTHFLSKIQQI